MGNVVGRGDYNILDFEMADISEQPALFSHTFLPKRFVLEICYSWDDDVYHEMSLGIYIYICELLRYNSYRRYLPKWIDRWRTSSRT